MHPERHERRFEYNIQPIASDQLPSFATKQSSFFKKHQEISLNSTSPIKGRPLLNASFDNRYKQSLPYAGVNNYSNYASAKVEQTKEVRDRTISTAAYRSRQENRNTENVISNMGSKEDKRKYQGIRPYSREDKSKNYYDQTRQSIANQNRTSANTPHHLLSEKISSQGVNFSRPLQENVNLANAKVQQPLRQRKSEVQEQGLKQVSERELIDKISRINRLNEQINSRLQRMLSKIDSYD